MKRYSIREWVRRCAFGSAALFAFSARAAAEPRTNAILEWNAALALLTVDDGESSPRAHPYLYALTHMAMSEAVVAARARRGTLAAQEAAAAEAAFTVAQELIQRPEEILLRLRGTQLMRLPATDADSGRALGAAVAAKIIAQRQGDGWPRFGAATPVKAFLESQTPATGGAALRTRRPLVLKKVESYMPEAPLEQVGVELVRVDHLEKSRLLDLPAHAPDKAVEFWRADLLLRWNRIAAAVAAAVKRDLAADARLFAVLNAALADSLLVAEYWRQEYANGRVISLRRYVALVDPLDALPDILVGRAPQNVLGFEHQMARVPVRDYPLTAAVLAGAAEAVLRWHAGSDRVTVPAEEALTAFPPDSGVTISITELARHCAGAAMLNSQSTRAAGVAGYRLGLRIGQHVVKHVRQ